MTKKENRSSVVTFVNKHLNMFKINKVIFLNTKYYKRTCLFKYKNLVSKKRYFINKFVDYNPYRGYIKNA